MSFAAIYISWCQQSVCRAWYMQCTSMKKRTRVDLQLWRHNIAWPHASFMSLFKFKYIQVVASISSFTHFIGIPINNFFFYQLLIFFGLVLHSASCSEPALAGYGSSQLTKVASFRGLATGPNHKIWRRFCRSRRIYASRPFSFVKSSKHDSGPMTQRFSFSQLFNHSAKNR